VIETSGLADPAPILQTMMTDAALAERLVLGSVATGALRHARVPVLLVRPTALACSASAPLSEGTGAPAEEVASEAIAVPLSPAELAHVRDGLELALHAAAPDAETAAEVRALLIRLHRGREAPSGQDAADLVLPAAAG
jgi:hypothetical protein